MEHRWGRRIEVNESVRLRALPEAFGVARLVDLSVSGAFVATNLRLPLFSRVRVSFDVRRGPHVSKGQFTAHVVRTAADGVGIEWDEVPPATVSALMSMFEFVALTPEQLSSRPARSTPRSGGGG